MDYFEVDRPEDFLSKSFDILNVFYKEANAESCAIIFECLAKFLKKNNIVPIPYTAEDLMSRILRDYTGNFLTDDVKYWFLETLSQILREMEIAERLIVQKKFVIFLIENLLDVKYTLVAIECLTNFIKYNNLKLYCVSLGIYVILLSLIFRDDIDREIKEKADKI